MYFQEMFPKTIVLKRMTMKTCCIQQIYFTLPDVHKMQHTQTLLVLTIQAMIKMQFGKVEN